MAVPLKQRQLYLLLRYPTLSQTFVRNEVQGLRSHGVDVDVVTVEGGESENIDPGWGGEHRALARPPSRGRFETTRGSRLDTRRSTGTSLRRLYECATTGGLRFSACRQRRADCGKRVAELVAIRILRGRMRR